VASFETTAFVTLAKFTHTAGGFLYVKLCQWVKEIKKLKIFTLHAVMVHVRVRVLLSILETLPTWLEQ